MSLWRHIFSRISPTPMLRDPNTFSIFERQSRFGDSRLLKGAQKEHSSLFGLRNPDSVWKHLPANVFQSTFLPAPAPSPSTVGAAVSLQMAPNTPRRPTFTVQ